MVSLEREQRFPRGSAHLDRARPVFSKLRQSGNWVQTRA